jgi:hypothetical protein
MARSPRSSNGKPSRQVDALKHNEATRRNIPTAEMESLFRRDEDAAPRLPKHYPRARPLAEGETWTVEEPSQPELIWNGAKITITDEQMAELAQTGTLTLSDAQLVWRGKDKQDWSDLVVNVPPLYIQEKIHPKAIIDDLKRRTSEKREAEAQIPDLFADFNGITPEQRAEFYQHDRHWSNRMILGDSLQVMASLAERESLKGKVQCIYFDPPYGIRFNSNWQVSTQSRDVKDGKQADISREPEQVKAFRDTWKVEILDDGGPEIRVKVNGVDVFDPNTGDIRSNDTAGIAAWFIDTDYDEESFFVRHAYFLGANDPYKSLKTALQAEIDEDAWATLYSDISRPFARPESGRIAVKVINHFGDEVMKVFRV